MAPVATRGWRWWPQEGGGSVHKRVEAVATDDGAPLLVLVVATNDGAPLQKGGGSGTIDGAPVLVGANGAHRLFTFVYHLLSNFGDKLGSQAIHIRVSLAVKFPQHDSFYRAHLNELSAALPHCIHSLHFDSNLYLLAQILITGVYSASRK